MTKISGPFLISRQF